MRMNKGRIVGRYIDFIFDLTAFQEGDTMKCVIGDDGYYERPAHPFIGSESVDRYPTFINRLYSSQFVFSAVSMSEGGTITIRGTQYNLVMVGKMSMLKFENPLIINKDTFIYLKLDKGKWHSITFYYCG